MLRLAIAGLLCLLPFASAQARTVYECLKDDRLSLSTAPEPGSKCKPKRVNDRKAKVPNFWGDQGPVRGNLYTTRMNGKAVYSTRPIKGWKEVAEPVRVRAPRDSWAHEGYGEVGKPRLDVFAAQFLAAAKKTGVEDAWLRAIAHAESDFNARALSPKGAQGVMQLMPALARAYGVHDPYQSAQSHRRRRAPHPRSHAPLQGRPGARRRRVQRRHRRGRSLRRRAAVRRDRGLRRKGAGPRTSAIAPR